jgi:hypothetical protein
MNTAVKEITPRMIGELMKSTNTHIGYVEFHKRDGEFRTMWFRTRWRKELFKDGQLNYIPERHGITIVRDINLPDDDCLRAIRWDSVVLLTVHGKTIEWDYDNETYIYRTTAEAVKAG